VHPRVCARRTDFDFVQNRILGVVVPKETTKNREKKEEKEEKRKERTPQNKHFLCCPTTQTNKQQARI
jgi:hypothetical protein